MKKWVEFTYILRSQYRALEKGSIVNVDGDQYIIKRIDRIILIHGEPRTAAVYARGVKRKDPRGEGRA